MSRKSLKSVGNLKDYGTESYLKFADIFRLPIAKTYLSSCQTSKMGLFAKIE